MFLCQVLCCLEFSPYLFKAEYTLLFKVTDFLFQGYPHRPLTMRDGDCMACNVCNGIDVTGYHWKPVGKGPEFICCDVVLIHGMSDNER